MASLTRRCIEQLAPAVKPGTTLLLEEAELPVFIYGDAVRMEQVVNNLINNANKYTGAGGVIRVSVGADAEHAVLRVSDTGAGLAPEMVERVFELFTQVEGSLDRAQGGMGIGLTLVRNLVALHGGTVTAQSAGLGEGSEFIVRIPRVTTAAASSEPQPREPTTPGAVRSRHVLIVEDNDDSRELLASILSRRGYHVFTAQDGQQGIDEALARRPSVLLVDIGLPGIDGYALARAVRDELGPDSYLVALTGYGQPDDRRRAAEAGFDIHLTKPVDISVLEQLLAALDRPKGAPLHA
jgi:CheY-like chemotaxis protein